jgi:hypothetical protein
VKAESPSGHTPVGSLLASRRKEAGIPHERHRDGATVQEIDDQEIVREADVFDALAQSTL